MFSAGETYCQRALPRLHSLVRETIAWLRNCSDVSRCCCNESLSLFSIQSLYSSGHPETRQIRFVFRAPSGFPFSALAATAPGGDRIADIIKLIDELVRNTFILQALDSRSPAR